jgi:hypothetical protein
MSGGPTEPEIEIARVIVEDHAGEGPIAFPELLESLSRRVFSSGHDADRGLARTVLREYLALGRIEIHTGKALDTNLPVADHNTAASLVDDPSRYEYGDGDEVRAWFSIEP